MRVTGEEIGWYVGELRLADDLVMSSSLVLFNGDGKLHGVQKVNRIEKEIFIWRSDWGSTMSTDLRVGGRRGRNGFK